MYIICIHLYAFRSQFNLLYRAQSGVRRFHSCKTALAKMASQWVANIDRGYLTRLVLYIDWVKLLLKSSNHILVTYVKLSNFNRLCLNPCWSPQQYPQSLHLGPLLFIIFMNDLPSHSNHMTSSKRADTLICHTTMRRNPINFLYNPDHVTLWCMEVGPLANAREGSMQKHDWARVTCL